MRNNFAQKEDRDMESISSEEMNDLRGEAKWKMKQIKWMTILFYHKMPVMINQKSPHACYTTQLPKTYSVYQATFQLCVKIKTDQF